MDWNWFHSAVAQSSAAIVGIFGAFIFTKIINNQALHTQRCTKIVMLLHEAKRVKEEAENRYYSWYNERTNESALNDLKKDLRDEETIKPSEYYFFNSKLSFYQKIDTILPEVQKLVEGEIARRIHIKTTDSSWKRNLLPNYEVGGFQGMDHILLDDRLRNRIETEGEDIDKVAISVRAQIRKINHFIDETKKHPEYSRLITFSILFCLAMFFVGVVYPLMQLPVNADLKAQLGFCDVFLIKEMVLIAIATLFTCIMAIFLIMNIRMKIIDSELEELTDFSNEKMYSKFLGYEADNLSSKSSVV